MKYSVYSHLKYMVGLSSQRSILCQYALQMLKCYLKQIKLTIRLFSLIVATGHGCLYLCLNTDTAINDDSGVIFILNR
jgi:hypothetical protein